MPRAGFIVTRVSFLVLAASLLGAAMLAAPAAGQTSCPNKCFAVAVSPSSPVAGQSTSFTFKITNEDSMQTLGSVQITAPTGFVITGASDASNTASFTSSSALFIDLAVPQSGGTTTLTVTAAATCGAGTYTWGIGAKQSNDFSGNGNDFTLDTTVSNLSGSVTQSCSLEFTGQPASTDINTVITTSAFDPHGGPVQVEILDGNNQLDTASSAEVSVAIGPNSGPGTLSGKVTVAASGGIASFSDLSIDRPGVYTLVATSPGISSATSGVPPGTGFTIFTASQLCTSATCSASASSATTSGTVTTTAATPGESIAASAGAASYTCGGVSPPFSDAFSFDIFDAKGAPVTGIPVTVPQEFPKSFVESTGHTGASGWEICYASTTPFMANAVPGTYTTGVTIDGIPGFNTGLLLDCTNTQGKAPCVQERHKDNAGDVVVTYLAFTDLGDGTGRGAW